MARKNIFTLFGDFQIGELNSDCYKNEVCRTLLSNEFGVDVDKLNRNELEGTLRLYQAEYELFLARIAMGHDSNVEIVDALVDKVHIPLNNGNKGIELINTVCEKFNHDDLTSLEIKARDKLNAELLRIAIYKKNHIMLDDILNIYTTQETKNSFLIVCNRLSRPALDQPNNFLEWAVFSRDSLIIEKIFNFFLIIDENIVSERQITSLLFYAIGSENLDAIEKILNVFLLREPRMFVCHVKDAFRGTLLHSAAKTGNVAIIEKILDMFLTPQEKRTACEKKSGIEWTPSCDSQIKICEQKYKETPLHYAALSGQVAAIEKILEVFLTVEAKCAACQQKENYLATPLHSAAASGNPAAIEKILSVFLTPEMRDIACQQLDGYLKTPLHCAAESGSPEAIEKILSNILTDEAKRSLCQKGCVEITDYPSSECGKTPLHFAAESGNSTAIEKILNVFTSHAEKREACQKKTQDGKTPLHYAAKSGNSIAIKKILDAFITPDEKCAACQQKANYGETPLHCAAKSGNSAAIDTILDAFTSQEEKHIACEQEEKGQTPLHFIAKHGEPIAIEKILNAFPTIEAKRAACQKEMSYGRTPLHYVAEFGSLAAIEKMLQLFDTFETKSAALCNLKDYRKNTPMYYIGRSQNLATIENFIDMFLTNKNIIIANQRENCVDLLMDLVRDHFKHVVTGTVAKYFSKFLFVEYFQPDMFLRNKAEDLLDYCINVGNLYMQKIFTEEFITIISKMNVEVRRQILLQVEFVGKLRKACRNCGNKKDLIRINDLLEELEENISLQV
jgi:ankyrin repeat protein